VLNNAAIGIVTSFFLAQLNSILKTFASALELLFTAVLCWILFGIPVHPNTALSIAIVSAAVWLYSKEPVQNTNANVNTKKKVVVDDQENEMQRMLDEAMKV
jgi:UDP-sugar transporter A1/2/3